MILGSMVLPRKKLPFSPSITSGFVKIPTLRFDYAFSYPLARFQAGKYGNRQFWQSTLAVLLGESYEGNGEAESG
jgi:hypothetical protein